MGLLDAEALSDLPYVHLPYDGVVGMGFEALSVSPIFNFFSSWNTAAQGNTKDQDECPLKGYLNQFAFFFPPSREGDGELALGGHVEDRLASPLVWVPVDKPQDGYWIVRLSAVMVGDQKLDDACPQGECWGLIDTSASRLGVPADVYPTLNKLLELSTPDSG